MSDQQLMQLAKCMGKEWKCIAIASLGLTKQDVDEIEMSAKGSLNMMNFHMLDLWRSRQSKGEAGVMQLYEVLRQEEVPREVIDRLEGECVRDSRLILASHRYNSAYNM